MRLTTATVSVTISVVAILANQIFTWLQIKRNESTSLKNHKLQTYSDMISVGEELRDAYFDGEPNWETLDPKDTKPGWILNAKGWTRPDPWLDYSSEYKEARKKFNSVLSKLTLLAPELIIKECFEIEQYSQDYRNSEARSVFMNSLVTLMKRDLGSLDFDQSIRELKWF